MQSVTRILLWGLTTALVFGPNAGSAAEIRAAVASNFIIAFEAVAAAFEAQTGHEVTPASGSTGKLYAQIINGAPFDVFFSADAVRPRRLEEEGSAIPDTRFTYAVGKLVLWSPDPKAVDPEGMVLASGTFRYLALASPELAPYGRAARQAMEKLGVWADLEGRMVRGENVGQAYQFVRTGNAELGFVAWSQVAGPAVEPAGSWWLVSENLYDPIEQQAVLLKETAAARSFLDFVRGEEARAIIRSQGYGTP